MKDYFSASLIKTEDLDPHKTYMFIVLPHGVIALSGWVNFVTDATGFSSLFPGVSLSRVQTTLFVLAVLFPR
jgi:hypothetical protein